LGFKLFNRHGNRLVAREESEDLVYSFRSHVSLL
jgi:hypothetical protein